MVNASQTVVFSSPVAGSRLMEVVKHLAERDGSTRFASEKSYDDGYTFKVGQTSGYPYLQVIVGASSEDLAIRPDNHYSQCVVQNFTWPNNQYLIDYEDDAVIGTVNHFAVDLMREVDGGESEATRTWPQSVMVCSICQHILWRSFDERWDCPTHGKNPPVQKLQVVPA